MSIGSEDDTPPLGTNIHALTSGEQALGLVQRCLEELAALRERILVLETKDIQEERDTLAALKKAERSLNVAREALVKVNSIVR